MSDVTDLNEKRKEKDPHISSPCICLSCKHEWIGVFPIGTTGLECPSCGLMRGTYKYQCSPEDGIVWVCGCGNSLFVISVSKNAICISCGQHCLIE